MDPKLFLTVFATIFVAEVGDKTQLATLLYAADVQASKLTVFAASASALTLAAGLGVAAGAVLSRLVDPRWLETAAGLGFVAIGAWTLWRVWTGGS